MPRYLAQRGTKVALIDAPSRRAAGPSAARALGLPKVRPSAFANPFIPARRSAHGRRQAAWLDDWRGRRASLRPASDRDVAQFMATVEQADEVRTLTRTALRDRVRGHHQEAMA